MSVISMYVLKYLNGKYADIDRSSGGYPYPVESVLSAYRFPSYQEMDEYRSNFPYLVPTIVTRTITERMPDNFTLNELVEQCVAHSLKYIINVQELVANSYVNKLIVLCNDFNIRHSYPELRDIVKKLNSTKEAKVEIVKHIKKHLLESGVTSQ